MKLKSLASYKAVISISKIDFYLIIMIPFVLVLNSFTVKLHSFHTTVEKSAMRGVWTLWRISVRLCEGKAGSG